MRKEKEDGDQLIFPKFIYYPIHSIPYLIGLYSVVCLYTQNIMSAIMFMFICFSSGFVIERTVKK